MLFSQIIPPLPSPTESKSLFLISVSFLRFFVGCICSYANYVGGWYFALNALVCVVFAVYIGMVAHVMGIDNKMLMAGILLLAMIIGVFCLWVTLWFIVRRKVFPKCKSGCCCGMNDYSYRFGTWMGLVGWRKWLFVHRFACFVVINHSQLCFCVWPQPR